MAILALRLAYTCLRLPSLSMSDNPSLTLSGNTARRGRAHGLRGLFPVAEQEAVLALLEWFVVFVTAETLEPVLRGSTWARTAWNIADLYLGGSGADPLGDDALECLGLNGETRCYVSPAYFENERPFEDSGVHEVAHIFHSCKRRTAGLPETRRKALLVELESRKRETFAYACEAYAWILERTKKPSERPALARELDEAFGTQDERVERGEIADLFGRAVERRNGWKVMLAHCAPPRARRTSAP